MDSPEVTGGMEIVTTPERKIKALNLIKGIGDWDAARQEDGEGNRTRWISSKLPEVIDLRDERAQGHDVVISSSDDSVDDWDLAEVMYVNSNYGSWGEELEMAIFSGVC